MNAPHGSDADLDQMNSVPGAFIVNKKFRAGIEKYSQFLADEGVLRVVFDESQIHHARRFSELAQQRRQAVRPRIASRAPSAPDVTTAAAHVHKSD
jgi:hypothetical protein